MLMVLFLSLLRCLFLTVDFWWPLAGLLSLSFNKIELNWIIVHCFVFPCCCLDYFSFAQRVKPRLGCLEFFSRVFGVVFHGWTTDHRPQLWVAHPRLHRRPRRFFFIGCTVAEFQNCSLFNSFLLSFSYSTAVTVLYTPLFCLKPCGWILFCVCLLRAWCSLVLAQQFFLLRSVSLLVIFFVISPFSYQSLVGVGP